MLLIQLVYNKYTIILYIIALLTKNLTLYPILIIYDIKLMFWGILGGTLACAGHLLAPTIREGVVEG